MLKEFDKDHARSGSGIYTVEELRPAAGAACAARLISDIEAISLADHEGTDDDPVISQPKHGRAGEDDCGARPPRLRGGSGTGKR